MKLHGREVMMAYTVGAMQDIAQMCPDKDIRKIGDLFSADDDMPFDFGAVIKLVSILSYWGEEKHRWENPGYERRPFTEDELKTLMPDQIQTLLTSAMSVMRGDSEQTIETEPEKNPKKD